ncbi:alpha/beta fold hydrolase [Actinokineospora sp. G85]|uniref:alpha/beta fold hydrolase n=1 Tax=Actinokineospora sp. G85 TaxID=3406626 RepID=UPI003C78EAE0
MAQFRTGATAVGTVVLGHRETGDPTANPVVLLHGLGSNASTWDKTASALADAGHTAIALDARGHGDSLPATAYTLDLMTADLLAFLDRRGLPQVDLVGHSMGGAVAHLLAARHPTRVRRLVIEDMAPPPHTPPDPPHDAPPPDPPQPVDFDWRLVAPILRQVNTPDPQWWALLPAITAPTLLIAGGPASHVPQDLLHESAKAIPDARVVEINVGHHVHREAPEEFTQALLSFLR